MNFSSARAIHNRKQKKHESKDVDQIFNALEIVDNPNEDDKSKKMSTGIHMLKKKSRSNGLLSFLSGNPSRLKESQMASQNVRYMSNYKAELVRHNIITRTDLMKLYQPPLKKHQLPHKDPFLTKQIV